MTTVVARCYSTTNGIRRITVEPPTNQEVAEIRALGERAIEPLAAYLDSERRGGRMQWFAVRFLIAVGGPGTFAPLQKAFAEDPWEVTKAAALAGMFAA